MSVKAKKKTTKSDIIKLCILLVFFAAMIAAAIYFFPEIKKLSTQDGRAALKEQIESFGFVGRFVYVGVWIIQIVAAFIPGEPIEIIGGMLFGMWEGLLLCLIGVLAGSIIAFYLVKLLGKPFVTAFINEEKLSSLKIMQDERRLEMIIFILFFIPGTPKDMLTYIVPLSPIKPLRFFVIATLSRIPSIASSVLVGATLDRGNIWLSVGIFLATGAVGIVGIMFNDRFMNNLQSKRKGKNESDSDENNIRENAE